MFIYFKQLYHLLTKEEKFQAAGIFLAILLMACFEVIGVAAIMPFIAVVNAPAQAIFSNPKLAFVYHYFHFTSPDQFMIWMGFGVLFLLIISNSIAIFTTWSILNFSNMREFSLSTRLLKKYLFQPYVFFLNRNASELCKNILSEVSLVVNNAFVPGMQLLARLMVTISLIGLMIFVNPFLAFGLGVILGGTYLMIFFVAKNYLKKMSKRYVKVNKNRFKYSTEVFGGIKDVKLMHKENYFINHYAKSAYQFAKMSANSTVIGALPRYAIEIVAFGGVLLIIIYLLLVHKQVAGLMPLLALYAFACYRLLPALQLIFSAATTMRYSQEALQVLSLDLKGTENGLVDLLSEDESLPALPFKQNLSLCNVSFSYPEAKRLTLDNISLTIPRNATIGFVGMTGSGKTTTADIILGLLEPQQGCLKVDEVVIEDYNLLAWQKNLAYVQQAIYLADQSIAQNIAFGVDEACINMGAVKKAAKMASIDDFIERELPEGYSTIVGDRGVRLSGGQRQRIGIARALYSDPEVLVFDEATSALDVLTEDTVMKAITNLSKEKTIIIIAHRLSTVQSCDLIFFFDHGKLIANGTYEWLAENNSMFNKMIKSLS
jgi:ABC-type multidrug transport system fused ATPase/permease subunit